MNKLKTLVLLGTVAASTSVFALPIITGNISIDGTVTTTPAGASLNQSVAGHATGFASITPLTATGSGDFAGFVSALNPVYFQGINAAITYSPFSWQPASTPQLNVWTIAPGGVLPYTGPSWSFDLLTISVTSSGNQTGGSFIGLSGSGVLHGTGFADTVGIWDFHASTTDNSVHFGFHNTNTAVPDGGTTAALLGLGVLSLGALRRKLS